MDNKTNPMTEPTTAAIDENLDTCTTAYCHFNHCAADCGSVNNPTDWCYTTNGSRHSHRFVKCTIDSDCDGCWNCASDCGQKEKVDPITVSSFLILNSHFTEFTERRPKVSKSNYSSDPKIRIELVAKFSNENIIKVLTNSQLIFAMTDLRVLTINPSDHSVTENMAFPSRIDFSKSELQFLQENTFLISYPAKFSNHTINDTIMIKQIFVPQIINLTEPKIDSNIIFDDRISYDYAPIGKRLLSDGIMNSNWTIYHRYYSLGKTLNDHRIFSYKEYSNVLYYFQVRKSSFYVQYDMNKNNLILTEVDENGPEIIERKSSYYCPIPVGLYYDSSVNKLYIVTSSNKGLSMGWLDPFDTFRGRIKVIKYHIRLPFDIFQEFLVYKERMVFNLASNELVLVGFNETILLYSSNESIYIDGYVKTDNDTDICFHTSSELSCIVFSRSIIQYESVFSYAIYASIFGLLLIPIIIIVSIFIIKNRRKVLIVNRSNKSEKHTALHSTLSRQPIFIFNESLSNITVLSKGAFGEVSRGIYDDGVRRQEVAIKSLFRFNAEKIKQEADIACSLNHPNVLSLIGICFDPGNNQLKLVMPFMVNSDLGDFLDKLWTDQGHRDGRKGKHQPAVLNGSLLKSFASQIAAGMAYLVSEDQGHPSIIHRDLAARNCMVDADLTIKVADFGLSRHLDSTKVKVKRSLQTSMIPSSSAPESIAKLIFTEKSDVYSYGSLLLELYDCNIDVVPLKILDLSDICHSVYPDERPTFDQIKELINKFIDSDFEPINDNVNRLMEMISETPMSSKGKVDKLIKRETLSIRQDIEIRKSLNGYVNNGGQSNENVRNNLSYIEMKNVDTEIQNDSNDDSNDEYVMMIGVKGENDTVDDYIPMEVESHL